jgi:uncharacterized protein
VTALGPTDDPGQTGANELGWIVNNFVDRVKGVRSALVVTSDGLVLAHSVQLERSTSDRLAAIISGLSSLSAGVAGSVEGGIVNQLIVEMAGGYFFVTAVGDSSALAVLAEPDCDIGQVGYEMSLLVTRIGRVLTPALRLESRLQLPPR